MVKDISITNQIKNYLKRHKIPAYKLAERLGVPASDITRWIKTGRISNISIQLLKREGVIK